MALGRAFIEVHADTRPFARQVGPQVSTIIDTVEKSIRDKSKGVGDALADSLSEGIERNKEQISRSVSSSLSRSRTKVKVDVDVDVDKNRFLRTAGAVADVVQKGMVSAFNALGDSVVNTTDSIQKMIGGLLNVSSVSLPVAVALIAIGAIAIPVLLSATVALAAALANLIGLIPIMVSGFGVLLAAIFPIVVAFQGFGDALDAVFAKDPEKLAEAMKKLTPSARGLITELKKALPFFDELKKKTQEAFFKPLQGVLTSILASVKGPLLAGFTAVADAAGRFLAAILSIGNTPGFAAFAGAMFQGAVMLFDTLQGPMVAFLQALMNMMVAALPFFTMMVEAFGRFLTRFSDWINESVKNGSFQEFLTKAWSTLTDIGDLVGAVIELFRTMFSETEEGGRTFLQLVTEAVRDLTEFFKSEDGKKALKAMVDLAILFGSWLLGAAQIAIFLMNQLERIADLIKWIVRNLNGVDISKVRPGFTRGPTGVVGKPFAEGGVITEPTLALMGEGHRSEAIIPLTNPRRAQEIADQTGLSTMLSGGGDTFIFYLGEEQITARIVRIASGVVDASGRQLTAGVRAA